MEACHEECNMKKDCRAVEFSEEKCTLIEDKGEIFPKVLGEGPASHCCLKQMPEQPKDQGNEGNQQGQQEGQQG